MATADKPKTMPWGERVITHEATLFFYLPGWKALAEAQNWIKKGEAGENRHLVPSREVLEEMVRTNTTRPKLWITTNTEEDFGIDIQGIIGKKGESVMLTIHGGGIILQNQQSLQAAYTNKTPKGEPIVQQEKITAVLSGGLPNGQQIKVYTFESLMKEDPATLPQVYAIAMPLKDLEGTPSGTSKVDDLPKNRIYIARAGHPTTAADFVKLLREEKVKQYGNKHALARADTNNPSGRVLHAYSLHYDGLSAYSSLKLSARFVGVRLVVGAGGAAAQK